MVAGKVVIMRFLLRVVLCLSIEIKPAADMRHLSAKPNDSCPTALHRTTSTMGRSEPQQMAIEIEFLMIGY